MAKIKKELILTNEEIDTLTKANLVLEKIIKELDVKDGIFLGCGDIGYPNILDEVYQSIDSCFY